ncbi:ExeM/NucH family extracellular endonuclease [Glaciibacter flavus]|uniref:ExeM/NucH family extracellular endonuclease n=1 Tax=Orlajensenia flava TaxID=2565934 RepID=UPI003AFF9C62
MSQRSGLKAPSESIFRGARRAAVAVAAAGALALGAFTATPAFAATLTIAEVQGTGSASPYAGAPDAVTVDGIVTADERTGGYNGVYIQTAGSGGETDATPGASDGIFVFLGSQKPSLAIGDAVSVTGKVSEYFGLTQISASTAGALTVTQPGAGLPAVTPLPDSVRGADREAYEGMLVAPTGTYRLSSSHQLYNFGTLWLSAGADQLVTATEQATPGADAQAIAAANRADRILLDDGWNSQVTSAAHVGDQPYFTTDTVVRNGDVVDFPVKPYVLSYGFDDWRLQPQIPITDASSADYKPTFEQTNPRPAAPPEVGGDIRLASFNVYNYFTTLTSENSNARGAATAEQFAKQQAKIVAAINGLGADVVSLEEIENSVKLGEPKDEALGELVDALNAAAGSDVWAFVPTPDALNDASITDYITTALIYKPASVTRVGDSKTVPIDETVWGNAREPIAQTFSFQGKTITVAANHLKSKTPPSGATGEPADGQGYFNADRVKQAQATLAWTEQLRAEAHSDDVFLIGDFNAYANEDPIQVFVQAGWTDLVPAKAAGQYTYSFNGELGSLDHVLASPSVAPTVTGVGVWNINSPEWSDRGYAFGATDGTSPYRSSDHDPIVVGVSSAVAPVDIDLVTVNDFHGRIENESGSAAAGIAALSTAVKQVRASNPNTVFAAAGDMIGASTFTSFIQQDKPTIDALNAAGLDVSSVGNHEFDKGWADLRDRVIPAASWDYLGANVFLKNGQRALPAYSTETFNGVTVGFIGAVTNELPSLVSPAGIADLDIRDVTASVNEVAAELKDGDPSNGEADVLVLLVHEGAATTDISSATDPNSPFGTIVNGVVPSVNAIVSGHTHLAYDHVINGRPVISSGQYGEKFSVMDIQVNPQTKQLLSAANQTFDLKTKVVNGSTTTYTPNYADDPAVAPIVADAVAKANVLGAVKLGDITADFNRAKQSNGSENRGGESTLGNFVADVQLWSAQRDAADIQVALMNPGGLRADLTFASTGPNDPDGNLTYKEAAVVQPFANTLVTETLTGAQLKQVLEQQWQPATAARPFLKLGVSKGLTYTEDPTAPAGSHITHLMLGGVPVTDAQSIRVVVNSFLASGGDNFTTLAQGANKADSGKVDLSSMVDYMAANSPASPDYAQRAVGLKLTAPASGTAYAAGESVTADLSSLAFSAGEPAATEVQLSIGGTVVGTAPIDPTIVDTTDEVGRASVTFTVPTGVSGAQQLTIAVPSTGTSISVPIAITQPVPAVASTTVGYASTVLASHNTSVKYTVIVVARGTEPTGEVSIFDGSKKIASVTLNAGDKGRATITLPKLKAGVHLIRSSYAGSDTVKPSTSLPFPVILW